MKAVVTVTGKDKQGIIAKVSAFLWERGANIEDISQTVLGEYFAMIMLVDVSKSTTEFSTLALLNDAVKKGGVMASSRVGGLSGAFIPVSEDIGMIRAAEKGKITLDKLEAMTCVAA